MCILDNTAGYILGRQLTDELLVGTPMLAIAISPSVSTPVSLCRAPMVRSRGCAKLDAAADIAIRSGDRVMVRVQAKVSEQAEVRVHRVHIHPPKRYLSVNQALSKRYLSVI